MARTRILLLVAVSMCVAWSAAIAGKPIMARAATTFPLDPSHDVAVPSGAMQAPCQTHPMGSRCENLMVRALNHGRSVLGAPAYQLPARFDSLVASEQLLVLANLDRKLYHRPAIVGLNPSLDSSAEQAAVGNYDPAFVQVGGQSLLRGSSNWAEGMRSPLVAYFMWMYHDGIASWRHRQNVLMANGSLTNTMVMGVGSARLWGSSPAWTSLFEVFGPGTVIQCVPTVVSLSTRSGTDPGTSSIRVFGFGFMHIKEVTFGGKAARFSRLSAFAIRAVPPPRLSGWVHVRVVTAGGTSNATAAAGYYYP